MLTLEEAKTHLRVDHTDDDDYIAGLVAAAQEYIQAIITPPAEDDETPASVPAVNETQRQAARLLVGHWYQNREGVVEGSLSEAPMAVRMLIQINRPSKGLF